MRTQIYSNRGTPQAAVDWSEPEEWIKTILQGEEKALALELWRKSEGKLNPRYAYRVWVFGKNHHFLIEDNNGKLKATEAAGNFFAGQNLEIIDAQEGLLALLNIIADYGPGKRSAFFPHFAQFVRENSNIKSDNPISHVWNTRIQNLIERDLIARSGNSYEITQAGLDYLKRTPQDINAAVDDPLTQIRELQFKQNQQIRQQMMDALAQMNPYSFEQFVAELLEAMGYTDVQVTQKSRDGGVDVIANIKVGITLVKEVVQVKRYNAGSVGDKPINELRGRLPRFGAIRGTIITNSRFTKSAKDSAFQGAPITLIDGETLITLMLENEIGVKYEEIKIPRFNPSHFMSEENVDDFGE